MKNLSKFSIGLVLTLFCISPLFSQTFSRTYNPNLPIAFTAMLGIPQFSAKELFVAGNLKGKSAEDDIVGSIESTSNTSGVFSGSLLLKIENKNIMRVTINIQSDTDGDFNYITYVSIKNLLTAATSETRWRNGDIQTAARLVGNLVEIINMVYDKNKLFGPEYAAAQAKTMQEAAEKKAREEKEAAERKIREENIAAERQKSGIFSQRFEELPFAYNNTINEKEFPIFMELYREYIATAFEYRDDYNISRDIRNIEALVTRVINKLNGQQKLEYYSEFYPDKVEQVKIELKTEEERQQREAERIAEIQRQQAEYQQMAQQRQAEEKQRQEAARIAPYINQIQPTVSLLAGRAKFSQQEFQQFIEIYSSIRLLKIQYPDNPEISRLEQSITQLETKLSRNQKRALDSIR